jgi:hypothetical protein
VDDARPPERPPGGAVDTCAALVGDRRLAARLVDDLVAGVSGARGVGAAMHRFGGQLGRLGVTLPDAAAVVDAVERALPRRERRALVGADATYELAAGWAEGFVRGADLSPVVDPRSGLVTPPVLERRLRELYERCTALGVGPGDLHAVVVVDVAIAGQPPLLAATMVAAVASTVTGQFPYDVAAGAGGRIAVLAGRSQATRDHLSTVTELVRRQPGCGDGTVLVWLEPLPEGAAQLSQYVADLLPLPV